MFILEYHEVSSGPSEPEGTVSATRLQAHLEHLRRHFRIVSLSEAVTRLEATSGPTEDFIVLTFDDGYAGNHDHAWPILRELSLKATVFLTTGFLDRGRIWFDTARRLLWEVAQHRKTARPEIRGLLEGAFGTRAHRLSGEALHRRLKYLHPATRDALLDKLAKIVSPPERVAARPLTWEQARQMSEGGIEFGCHTVTHPILSTLTPAEQRSEILEGRERIGEQLGFQPRLFAYPNGSARDFSQDTVEILGELGFKAACTTIRGSNKPQCDPLRLRRIGVGADSVAVLDLRLSGLIDERFVAQRSTPAVGAIPR